MIAGVRLVRTNLIARDWRGLGTVLMGSMPVLPARQRD
jgi:hypothetical protein